ncbi:MAG: hypothetical protein JXQ65_15670 [Candidatus Marinimicrobia bacterium]|nr:hypothetical protein [Candidatus Neomarinimicrobiota bacterium]
MKNNYLRIAELVPSKLHHLIWKDESRDTFILTKFAEIHRFEEDTCRMICWTKSAFNKIKKSKLLFDVDYTDDGLYMALFKNEDLPKILNFGIHLRRPHHSGKWLLDKKERLAHDIRPYDGKSITKPAYNEKFYQKLSPQIKSSLFAHLKPPEKSKAHQEELL